MCLRFGLSLTHKSLSDNEHMSHFWHLIWRSLVYMPSIISGNWVSIFFPLAIFLAREFFRIRKEGWQSLNVRGMGRDALWMFAAYGCLLAWAVVHTVYEDHESLARRVVELNTRASGFNATLSMVADGIGAKGGLMVFASVYLENGIGADRPLRDWQLKIAVDSKTVEPLPFILSGSQSTVMPFASTGTGALLDQARYCPIITENPIPRGANRACWMMRVFDLDVNQVVQKDVVVIVSFKDGLTGEIHELRSDVGPQNNNFPPMIRGKYNTTP